MKELNVALRDGTEVKGLLDAQNLTTRVEMKMARRSRRPTTPATGTFRTTA